MRGTPVGPDPKILYFPSRRLPIRREQNDWQFLRDLLVLAVLGAVALWCYAGMTGL
jgi:hypothetical protein